MNSNELFKYMTKNRKLKLEEYDDNGTLIDVREFSENDMFAFIHQQTNNAKALSVARIKDLNIFSDEELVIVEKLIDYSIYKSLYSTNRDTAMFYWFTKIEANKIRKFLDKFDGNYNIISFALDLAMPVILDGESSFKTRIGAPYFNYKLTLGEALDFIKNRDGIYYTVNNNGERVYDFVDMPTKKQVKYQRTKNSNRTVFLNFKDWKEYIIDESEL